MHRTLRVSLIAAALVTAPDAWGRPLYKDDNWGVIPQDGGKICVVVLNSNDRKHAFHILIDGARKQAFVGILDEFLPGGMYVNASAKISMHLGVKLVLQLQFKRQFDGALSYLAAPLAPGDLDPVLAALRAADGSVSLAFENGDIWRIPPPGRQEAGSAITQCWRGALSAHE